MSYIADRSIQRRKDNFINGLANPQEQSRLEPIWPPHQ